MRIRVNWVIPGLDNGLALSYFLNQFWLIVNWTLRNILQWNFSWYSDICVQQNLLENVVCEMAIILDWFQCVNPQEECGLWFYITSRCPFSITGVLCMQHWHFSRWDEWQNMTWVICIWSFGQISDKKDRHLRSRRPISRVSFRTNEFDSRFKIHFVYKYIQCYAQVATTPLM